MAAKGKMTIEEERNFYKEALDKITDFLMKEFHLNYGPCDGLGLDGNCSECIQAISDLKRMAGVE